MLMQTITVETHITMGEILSGAGTLLIFIFGLLFKNQLGGIKLTQALDKSALLLNQHAVKEDLVASQMRIKDDLTNTTVRTREELLNYQARMKEELIVSQGKLKEDLVEDYAETRRALDVHIAQDEERFSSISRTLTRLDADMTRRESAVHSNDHRH